MRNIKITCDRCGTEVKLQNGSEVQLSGWLIGITKEQIGSLKHIEEYEVCGDCLSVIRLVINGRNVER